MYIRIFLILISILYFANTTYAQEKILLFFSDITINTDSSITVIEQIKVNSEGKEIKRGIYRDFPTTYKDKYGNSVDVGFELIDVKRNNQTIDFHIETIDNGQRIYFGNMNKYIEPGEHNYILIYKTTEQIGFFKNHDELYWNVTGNNWIFPIDKAISRINLPNNTKIIQNSAYTGVVGSTNKDYNIYNDEQGNIVFQTTKALSPKEGLTIRVSWPKGIVIAPDIFHQIFDYIAYNKKLLTALFSILFVTIYYTISWFLVGRDPKSGTIVPIFSPPDNLSPSLIYYIKNMGFSGYNSGDSHKALAAALVNMSVKNTASIEIKKKFLSKEYSVRKFENNSEKLSIEEQYIFNNEFDKDGLIIFKKSNSHKLEKMLKNFESKIKAQASNIYYNSNTRYVIFGAIISVVLFIKFDFVSEKSYLGKKLLIYSLVAINLIFSFLLKAPTTKGRKIIDKIEGFKLYLSNTGKERFNPLYQPEMTPDIFEKYLPYAIALGVSNKWLEKFISNISGTLIENYSPSWYIGTRSWIDIDKSDFIYSLENSFSNAISSSFNSRGSKSGSFGRGSSGGGRRGGGGGGGF